MQQESRPPFRVLYIEDNALVREITSELLAGPTLEIIAVGSAEEALVAFKNNRFDIVLTDVSLPAMSGIDLARQIKQLAPLMPVILASGYPLNPDDARLGEKVHAIRKPFDTLQLEALIHELCGGGGAAGPPSAQFH